MAVKRAAPPPVHPSRREQVPDAPRHHKRRKPDNAGPKSFKKAHPINELKSQIRSLKRLLERNDNLPANVRVEKERALQTARRSLDDAQAAKKNSEMIGKYHKIRFFDRQTATRRLKRARRDLEECEKSNDGREALVQRVADAEVDVNYALYYPLDQHYVPLFPRHKGPALEHDEEEEDDGDNVSAAGKTALAQRRGNSEMRQRIKQSMADGTLDALRSGKLAEPVRPPDSVEEKQVVGQTQPRTLSNISQEAEGRSEQLTHEEDDDSDGGFFE